MRCSCQNVAGVLGSLASRRIIVTLFKVFTQCRGFEELGSETQAESLNNMVSQSDNAQDTR